MGTEHEKLGYARAAPHARPTHEQISDMLTLMHQEDPAWGYIMEKDSKIGLTHGDATVTLEPGGQTELSGAPLADLHAVAKETQAHLEQVGDRGRGMWVRLQGGRPVRGRGRGCGVRLKTLRCRSRRPGWLPICWHKPGRHPSPCPTPLADPEGHGRRRH